MNRLETDDEIDAWIRSALRSRPEPSVSSNLAERVIATAKSRSERGSAVAARRSGRWERLVTLGAAVLLLAVLTWGVSGVAALRASPSASAITSAESGSSSETSALLVVGVFGLAASIVILAMQSSLSRDEEAIGASL